MERPDDWMRVRATTIARRRMLRGAMVGGLGLGAAALVGCSGGPKTAAPAPVGGSAAAAGAPKMGGRLAGANDADAPTFDMHGGVSTTTNGMAGPAYNQLVQFDPAVGTEGPNSIIPDLAEKWEVAGDGMRYTFHLAKGVKFHDGTPFTSADAKASLERNQTPPAGLVTPRSSQLRPIQGYETPDANTLVIKLSRPMSSLSLLAILGQGWMSIYSKKDIEGKFDYQKQMNGTGPYRLAGYERGNKVSLDRYKDYHIKGRPYLDGLDVFIVKDTSTALANIQSGAIHLYYLSALTKANQDTLKKAMGDKADYPSLASYTSTALQFNGLRPTWKDQRTRLAVAQTVNKMDAIKLLGTGDGVLGAYMPPAGPWSLSRAEIEAIPGYGAYNEAQIADSKKLLAAAGVPDGFKFSILTESTQSAQTFGLFIADQLKKVGMNASIDPAEQATARDRVNKREFELTSAGGATAIDDPDAIFAQLYLTNAPGNYSSVGSKAVDDLYLKQSMELGKEKRIALVKDLQKAAVGELGTLLLFWKNRHGVVNKMVKNYTLHASGYNNARMENVWLDK